MQFSSVIRHRANACFRHLCLLVLAGMSVISPGTVGAATGTVGSRITLYVTADGSPAPTFQWKKNGVNIAGATGSTLIIAAAALADAGTYRVTATNSYGSADSPDEVLTIDSATTVVAPAVTQQPGSASLTTGASATFTVAASGTPAPTYQWRKNGVNIAGATNATYTIASVAAGDSASYTAVATNSGGTATSSAATLTVTDPVVVSQPTTVAPTITSQPAGQTVASGATVTLSVSATGTPTPTYQWQKNDVAVAGATAATLTLTGVSTTDSGSYAVVVSNSAGSVSSGTATVSVSAPVVTSSPPPPAPSGGGGGGGFTPVPVTVAPAFTSQPANQNVLAGQDVTFAVTASGSPAPTLQWRKNGVAITGATDAALILRNTTAVDAATYSVVATNSAGSVASSNAVLSIGVKPSFSVQPTSQAVNLGARVTLSATVIASPSATLQWYKNGVAVTGATSSSLFFNSVTSADLATYRVTATNSWGSVTSADATLAVAATPIITQQPVSQTVAANSNVTFSVKASGSPTPTYQWKKNGVNIAGATTSILTLTRVSSKDQADYSVEAINSVGWVPSARATLKVSGTASNAPATAAITPEATPSDSRIVNLSVRSRAGSGANSLIVGFVIGGEAAKPMLVRGVGPTLGLFGVPDVLADPTLSLYSGATMTASNDDWAKAADVAQVSTTSARLGAFSLPEGAADAALLANLNTGAYTVQVNGKADATGVALVEVYDAAADNPATLINLSVRTFVGTGVDAPNVGFVVSGTTAKRVLVRVVGPTLSVFGVSDVLADPQLEVFKGGERIETNDNWGGSAELAATFTRVGAFGLAEAGSRDAATVLTLAPGAYTVVASGANGSTGVALVEVYDVP